MKMELFDSHMHTALCKHAKGYLWEYVDRGWKSGLDGVIFTCHSPMPDGFSPEVRMRADEIWDYIALVDEAADSAPEGFEVRLGLESDYFPGMEKWLENLHDTAPFHYILGSVHWHLPEYRSNFQRGDLWAFYCQYFEHLAEAAESQLFDCLAHPDHVKGASTYNWDPKRLQAVIGKALDRIAAAGVAMELNTSCYSAWNPQMYPGPEILEMMKHRSIPVVLGSDAHQPDYVGSHFEVALGMLEKAGYDTIHSFQDRQKKGITIAEARSRLAEAVVCGV